ncbi:MAG: hypothetical protein ACP5I3_03320 [Thermoproteus sp.]|jgi:uncharacterized protein YlxW (UPF0749 family)
MDVYTLKFYKKAADFIAELDREISELEESVKALGAEVEQLKAAAEKYSRLQALLKKFKPGEGGQTTIEVTGLGIYIDPSPLVKYDIYSQSYAHMLDVLSVLKKVREVANAVITEGGLESAPIAVQYKQGIPVKLILT